MPTSNGTMTTSPPAFRQSPEYRPSSATQIPMGNMFFGDVFVRKDRGDQCLRNLPGVRHRRYSGFDRALGMKLLRGRSFDSRDDSTAELVVVIDEALAKSAWPGEDALGKIIDWNYFNWRVVGIMRATRDQSIWDVPSPNVFADHAAVRPVAICRRAHPIDRRADTSRASRGDPVGGQDHRHDRRGDDGRPNG